MPDLMTKQDAIEYLLYMKHDVQAKSPMDIALDTAIEALKQPTIEPEVRHGQWYEIQCFSEHGIPMAQYECTNCENEIERQRGVLPAYCEFCGARMDLRTPTEAALDMADSVMMGGADNA